MSRNKLGMAIVIGLIWGAVGRATAGPLPFLSDDAIRKVRTGEVKELVIKFREGDELPYGFSLGGDLVQTKDQAAGRLIVQRDFYVKMTKDKYLLSLDGKTFHTFQELANGTLGFGASADDSDHIANGVSGSLDVKLK